MLRKFHVRMNQADPNAGGGGGTPAPALDLTASPPEPTPNPGGAPAAPPSIWGDLKVEFPEGFDDTLKNEGSLKPFVGKDGKINYANLTKSYIHAQKAMGREKVAIPKDTSTEAEWNEFHKKVFGYSEDPNDYKLAKDEKSLIDDDFFAKFKKVAHESKVPAPMAQKMLGFIEGVSKEEQAQAAQKRADYEKQGAENLRKDWGEAYNRNLASAQRIIKEAGDESFITYLKENNLATDPTLIRFLASVGNKLYKEGNIRRDANGVPTEPMTPDEIEHEINQIRGDNKHAFNNPNHPNYKAEQQKMLNLYERKRRILAGQSVF